jgi:phage-related protein
MPDFPSNPKPDYPIEETPAAPEVLISVHRDGSQQRRLKGSGKGSTFRLSFGGSAPITKVQRDALLNHFAGQHGPLDAFNWTHPERTDETHLVHYVETPTFRLVGFNAYEGEIRLEVVPA